MSGSLLLVLVGAAVLGVVAFLAIRSMWRGRLRHAGSGTRLIGGLPPVPDTVGAPVIPATTGRYVGSALAPARLSRLGGDDEAVLTRYPEGIMVKRTGSRPIWIPDESIAAIRAVDDMLSIRWRLPSGMEIETGFRGDDRRKYADWLGESTW